jgi:dihydroorotase
MIYKNGMICDKNQYVKKDIRVLHGKIVEISDNIEVSPSSDVTDCTNLVIMPKIFDLNISVKDNKLNVKNLSDISQKAFANGFSSIVINSNCTPSINNVTIMELINTKKALKNLDNIAISCNSLTDDDKMSNIATLINLGCEAIQVNSDTNSNNLLRIAQYSKMKNKPILAKCFNKSLTFDKVMYDGTISSYYGLGGMESIAFSSEVAKMVEIAKHQNVKTVIQEVSFIDSLDLISKAKQENSNILSEVPILHLCLTDVECTNYNTKAKVFPPLVDENQKDRLLEALKDDKIDMLTSLSCEISNINKDLPFEEADYGIDIMSDYFSLCYTKLVKENIISLSKLSELISFNPALVLGVEDRTIICEGCEADFICVDLNQSIETSANSILSKFELFGKVVK